MRKFASEIKLKNKYRSNLKDNDLKKPTVTQIGMKQFKMTYKFSKLKKLTVKYEENK